MRDWVCVTDADVGEAEVEGNVVGVFDGAVERLGKLSNKKQPTRASLDPRKAVKMPRLRVVNTRKESAWVDASVKKKARYGDRPDCSSEYQNQVHHCTRKYKVNILVVTSFAAKDTNLDLWLDFLGTGRSKNATRYCPRENFYYLCLAPPKIICRQFHFFQARKHPVILRPQAMPRSRLMYYSLHTHETKAYAASNNIMSVFKHVIIVFQRCFWRSQKPGSYPNRILHWIVH